MLTCTGELSRNRTVGFELGGAGSSTTCWRGIGHVAEGVQHRARARIISRTRSTSSCRSASRSIACCSSSKSPLEAVHDVLTRPLKKEWS